MRTAVVLPAPFGPSTAEHRALGHGQVEAVEGADLAVDLDQPARPDHVLAPICRPPRRLGRHGRRRRRHSARPFPRTGSDRAGGRPRRADHAERRCPRRRGRRAAARRRCRARSSPLIDRSTRCRVAVRLQRRRERVEHPVDQVGGRPQPSRRRRRTARRTGRTAPRARRPPAAARPARRSRGRARRCRPRRGTARRAAPSRRPPGRRRPPGTRRSGTSPTAARRNRSCRRRGPRRSRPGPATARS